MSFKSPDQGPNDIFLEKSLEHPSAEILITLWRYYHEQTTNHVKLWLKVGCFDQKKLTFPDGEFC